MTIKRLLLCCAGLKYFVLAQVNDQHQLMHLVASRKTRKKTVFLPYSSMQISGANSGGDVHENPLKLLLSNIDVACLLSSLRFGNR